MQRHDTLNKTVCAQTGPAPADCQTCLPVAFKTLIWRRKASLAVRSHSDRQEVVLNGTKWGRGGGDLGPPRGEEKTGMSSWHGRNVTGAAREASESHAGRDVHRTSTQQSSESLTRGANIGSPGCSAPLAPHSSAHLVFYSGAVAVKRDDAVLRLGSCLMHIQGTLTLHL